MQANRAYSAGAAAAQKDLGITEALHPVHPPAPWTQSVGLPVRTASALEKRALYKQAFKGKDRIPGGPADKKKPSDFDPKALRKGTDHEMEHTTDRGIAREIASDHLVEHPHYYEKRITKA